MSLTPKEENRLRVFQNRGQRKTVQPKKDEAREE